LVEVNGISSGQWAEKVSAELVNKNGQWMFVNFYYERPRQDLVSLLKMLRDDRLRDERRGQTPGR
jgi:hypothetical protein